MDQILDYVKIEPYRVPLKKISRFRPSVRSLCSRRFGRTLKKVKKR